VFCVLIMYLCVCDGVILVSGCVMGATEGVMGNMKSILVVLMLHLGLRYSIMVVCVLTMMFLVFCLLKMEFL